MNVKTIPGTVLPCSEGSDADAFSAVASICSAAGGLSLSQIVGITGLEASTIQNWVKRGLVPRPDGKKYGERQIARILIISILRDCLQLEKIIRLMDYVNGSADDVSDDIIDEGELYNRLCAIISELDESFFSANDIQAAIDRQLRDYEGPKLDSKECLKKALNIMVTAAISSRLKQKADTLLNGLFSESITD